MITDWLYPFKNLAYSIFKNPYGKWQRAKRKIPPKRWVGIFSIGFVLALFPICMALMSTMPHLFVFLWVLMSIICLVLIPLDILFTLLFIIEEEEKQIGREITLEDWRKK